MREWLFQLADDDLCEAVAAAVRAGILGSHLLAIWAAAWALAAIALLWSVEEAIAVYRWERKRWLRSHPDHQDHADPTCDCRKEVE